MADFNEFVKQTQVLHVVSLLLVIDLEAPCSLQRMVDSSDGAQVIVWTCIFGQEVLDVLSMLLVG